MNASLLGSGRRHPRILLMGGAARRLNECATFWHGFWCEVTPSAGARFAGEDDESYSIRRAAVAEAFDLTREFDVLTCEVNELLVLAAEARRRGQHLPPVVALEVHGLGALGGLRLAIEQSYGFDPLPDLLGDTRVTWLAASDVQLAGLKAAGVPARGIRRLDASGLVFDMMLTDARERLLDPDYDDALLAERVPTDTVLLPGIGRRDPETWIRAVSLLPDVSFTSLGPSSAALRVVCANHRLSLPDNLCAVPFLPLEGFIAAIRRARICVICLQEGTGDGGHTTACVAQSLGVPIVASRVPGVLDYVDERAALLVPPGDPGALATGIRWLWEDPGARQRIAEVGREAEARRRRETEAGVVAMLCDALASAT